MSRAGGTIAACLLMFAHPTSAQVTPGPVIGSSSWVFPQTWVFPRSVYGSLSRQNEPWIAATGYASITLPYYELAGSLPITRGYIAFDMYRFGDSFVDQGSEPIVVQIDPQVEVIARRVETYARRRTSMVGGTWRSDLEIQLVQPDTVGRRLIFAPPRSVGPARIVLSFDFDRSIRDLTHLTVFSRESSSQSERYGRHLAGGYWLTSSMVFAASEQELFRTGRKYYSEWRLQQVYGLEESRINSQNYLLIKDTLSFLIVAHEMCHHYRGHTALGLASSRDEQLEREIDADSCAVVLAADYFASSNDPKVILFLASLLNQYALYTWSASELQTSHLPPYERTVALVDRLVAEDGPFSDLDFDPEKVKQTTDEIEAVFQILAMLREPDLELTGSGNRSDGPINEEIANRMMASVITELDRGIEYQSTLIRPDPRELPRLHISRARVAISESYFRPADESQAMNRLARDDLRQAESLLQPAPGSPEQVEIVGLRVLSHYRDVRALRDIDPVGAKAAADRAAFELSELNPQDMVERPPFLTRGEWQELEDVARRISSLQLP